MQKRISNRELFRQLLASNIQSVLDEWNGGTCMRLMDVRAQLQGMTACRHYMDLHTSKGHGYLCYTDRFFRAVQSINDAGYGISIRKHSNGQLWVFNTEILKHDNWQRFIASGFKTWTANYNRNNGYIANAELDEGF